MIKIRIGSLGFLTMVALMGCTAFSAVPDARVEKFLAKQGFDAEFSTPAVTAWERQTFNLLHKEQWQAKSRAEVPNLKRAYYRYTIVKETYQSQQEARDRGNRIHEKPLGLGPSDDKAFPLRAGFSFEKSVYVVSCNVSMFHEDLKDFTRELEREVTKFSSPR